MDKFKVITYIQKSFLSSILELEDVTDISYNGEDVYYVSNSLGRQKANITVEYQVIKDFIRQIANLCEKQFSYTSPILDISIDKYRIHATHQSIAKVRDEGVVTFSIRIASSSLRINDNSDFFTPQIVSLINVILESSCSIIIGGITSSGKTEFQKYLLTKLKENSRVIVIDNVLELDQIRNPKIDLTCWQSDEENINAIPGKLIKNALRNNPDWIILAEARDKEMIDVLNAAMTGMPVITTLHSFDVFSLPHRMGRMMLKGEQKIDFNEALNDIYYHFHYYFYLSKKQKGKKIVRYISQICCVNEKGEKILIYEKINNSDRYYKIPNDLLSKLDSSSFDSKFKETFGGYNHE